MTDRRTYTDDEKANALAVLESNGGNLKASARHLGIPVNTLRAWREGIGAGESVQNLRPKKDADLAELFERELFAVFEVMQTKRQDATYSQLATAAGIYTDKMRLLRNLPTEIVAVMPDVMGALQAMGQTPGDFFERIVERAVNDYGYRRASR